MKQISNALRLAATDLSNNLLCAHLTTLDLEVARNSRQAPEWSAPDAEVMRQRGLAHEDSYVAHLAAAGVSITDLKNEPEASLVQETHNAMRQGVAAIVQGALQDGRWYGRIDVLLKVAKPSDLGPWSYEVCDCKLAVETKAATILQLSLYSDLVKSVQGKLPKLMHVIPPGTRFIPESHRVLDFSAFHRTQRLHLESVVDADERYDSYPEPIGHCELCRWGAQCRSQRRDDDHLSLVAGITKLQRKELTDWNVNTRTELGNLVLPLSQKPKRGSQEGFVRVREQARIQVSAEREGKSLFEVFPPSDTHGFAMLPEASIKDVYLDFEGDPFVGTTGREYLFGLGCDTHGVLDYAHYWALSEAEEKKGFEWTIDLIMQRWREDPFMHVFHFGAYEPSAFKRLMGKYASREDEVDRMLRAGLMIDLHAVLKRSMRAGVEQYSLKAMEPFHGFTRVVPLNNAATAMRTVQHALELSRVAGLDEEVKKLVKDYNEDDCWSTRSLRIWLERERSTELKRGISYSRPISLNGPAPTTVSDRQQKTLDLAEALRKTLPSEQADRSEEDNAVWLLANLLDWHRRESKADWWEFFRLGELVEDELIDERGAVSGLRYISTSSVLRQIPTDIYNFPVQDCELKIGDEVRTKTGKFGQIVQLDMSNRLVHIKKTKKTASDHPTCVYVDPTGPNTDVLADSLLRLGEWVQSNGISSEGPFKAARSLLLRLPPKFSSGTVLGATKRSDDAEYARSLASDLDQSVLAIQGPPGSGKTYTASRMICELLKQGKKVGITANSHKVIANLLEAVLDAASEAGISDLPCHQKVSELPSSPLRGVTYTTDNWATLVALQSGCHLAAGTAWMWARPDFCGSVDVLFIDEAGQMSLANVLAVAQCAKSLVLLGDPQQLEQPIKGSHPEGAELSALQHLLLDRRTLPPDLGLFLEHTWRLHPAICSFTSEAFYDGRLTSVSGLELQTVDGAPFLEIPGLYFVEVEHQGNRTRSAEELATISSLVTALRGASCTVTDRVGNARPLSEQDILIVAPYNAQVTELMAALPTARVGTVDKFQGQEAPIAIYSLTASSSEDAPRGMEFLYSPNRLNVATSRAKSIAIIVGTAALLHPECTTPRQMQLANNFCRFAELASRLTYVGGVLTR
jgi:predicted RecB family nuclease